MLLPMFPLQSVFFPKEVVALHIFEERYKQLINDVRKNAMLFGVPVFIDGRISYGTAFNLKEIVKTYKGGEMDIICHATEVFKILSFQNQMGEKLYGGGTVEFLNNIDDSVLSLKEEVYRLIKELYRLMGVSLSAKLMADFNSYSFIHKIGLSLDQEYMLLQMVFETERLLYIKDHLYSTIQVLKEVNRAKKIIKMNGHFRYFDPIDFNNFNI